jgi:site-specific DNA recombinase
MQAAVYARVSTDRQAQDQTIDSQLTALRQWAADAGYDLRPEHVFADDGYSGSRLDRPALDRLRDAARDGEVEVVAVYSPDRLARKYAYQVLLLEEFQRAGCAVAFVHRPLTDDPHDQLLLQIQGAVAEYERAVLRERFRRGKLQKARAGQWVTSKAPFGYRYVPKRDGVPGHLEVDPSEAEVVRLLFGWLLDDRLTIRQMLKRLAAGPWRPRSGNRHWSGCVVRRILSDPTYTGTAYANRYTYVVPRKPTTRGRRAGAATGRGPERPRDEWIPIPVPPLIDESTHENALAQLTRNAALARRRNTRHTYLLRCLLTCRGCGLAMSGVTHRDRRGRVVGYYRCAGKDPVAHGRDRACPEPSPRVAELDAAVWGHVRTLLDDPTTLLDQFEAAAQSAAEPAEDRTEVQLRRLDREERRLLDAYQAEAIDLAELKARREQVAGRRRALEAGREQQARLRAEREAAGRVYADLTTFCARLRARLDGASVDERQRVLQLVIERVIVGADTLEVRHVIPLRPPGPPPAGGPPSRPAPRGEPTDSQGTVDGRTDNAARLRLRSLCVQAPVSPCGVGAHCR